MATPYLMVGFRDSRYALEAVAVREIVWLPRLEPIVEQPPHVRGIFNLRGRVVPVIDLGVRFGYGPSPAAAEHRVVVVAADDYCAGILIHDVHDVVPVAPEEISPAAEFSLPGGEKRFVGGVLKTGNELCLLLDVAALVNDVAGLTLEAPEGCALVEDAATDEDAALFLARARELAKLPLSESEAEQFSYAVLRLGGELYALDTGAVREFVPLRGLTPVPAAPRFVAGNMNVRGDILTVVDIRHVINISSAAPAGHVVVLARDNLWLGILAESIEDIYNLPAAAIALYPAASSPTTAEICIGTVTAGECIASLIDIERLLGALLDAHPEPGTGQVPSP